MAMTGARLRAIALAGLLTLTAMPALAQDVATDQGIDLANMDLTADPAVDFNQFVNGGWLSSAEIRADRSSTGAFEQLTDETIAYVLDMLERKAADGSIDVASDEGKAIAFFAQGMDIEGRNAAGITPAQPLLDEISGIASIDDLKAYQQTSMLSGVQGFLPLSVIPDLMDSKTTALYVGGPVLGLPNVDYYLKPEVGTPEILAAYVDASARLLEFAGYSPEEARTQAEAVLALETELAKNSWNREQQMVFTNFYNPMTAEELQASAPFMDWTAYQEALGLTPQERLIVTDPNYLAAIPGILEGTDLATLKAALTLQLMWGVANDLSDEIGQVAFDFKGKTLSGLEERAPLNERVLESVEQQLGFAVGKLYVEERFPPEAKAEVESLARDVIDAFRHRLENNTWMTPEARERALDKLSKVDIQIGYPDAWESYADVVVGDTYFETGLSAYQRSIRKNLSELGEPVDKTEWGMPPQAVNAYYSPLNNQIVFPAAFLQEPFYYAGAEDPAVNYGSIGYVIGHELTHGFDKQGSQFDGDGNLNSWYTPEDQAAFDALNQTLIDQYGAIEVAPGLFVNGVTSIGENTADLGGIQIAWDALQARLARDGIDPGEPDGVVEAPFTPEELFYLAAATVWRNLTRPEALETQINTDPHAPSTVRASQPMRNHEPFFEVIGIDENDPLWLAPEERIVIW